MDALDALTELGLTLEEQIEYIENLYSKHIQKLREKIEKRDLPAMRAYHETQKDLHNLRTRGWYELSENQRDEWRAKFGIKRV